MQRIIAMVIVLTLAILIACSGGGTENTTNAPTIPASTRASTASSSPPSPATPSLQATAAATATLAAAPAAAVPPTAYPVRTDNGIIGEDFIAKCSASYSQPGVLRTANQCQCAWDKLSEKYDQITLSNINWNGLDGDYYMDKVKDDCPA